MTIITAIYAVFSGIAAATTAAETALAAATATGALNVALTAIGSTAGFIFIGGLIARRDGSSDCSSSSYSSGSSKKSQPELEPGYCLVYMEGDRNCTVKNSRTILSNTPMRVRDGISVSTSGGYAKVWEGDIISRN